MNEDKKYEDAFNHLFKRAIPDEEAIDRMSKEQMDEFLADAGVDLNAYRERLAERKQRFAGKYALMRARQERLRRKDRDQASIEVPDTTEGIRHKLAELLNAPNLAKIFGRHFDTADYEELRQLYIDTVKEASANYGKDERGERNQGRKQGD